MRTKLLIFICSFIFASGYGVFTYKPYHLNSIENLAQKVFYNNGVLYVNGFEGSGTITIYSIIGNKVYSIKLSDLSSNKMIPVNLKTGNMFIIRVQSNTEIKTFKIIA
ncbi:T9SS type A sorting domain-containing protein [Flavobacteriaceae bacterium]|nr:T9SS type A sorting domain-containing protein [Flavobacteriaceae bacterium]